MGPAALYILAHVSMTAHTDDYKSEGVRVGELVKV